jgi:glycosyltransferase domain-containing protein
MNDASMIERLLRTPAAAFRRLSQLIHRKTPLSSDQAEALIEGLKNQSQLLNDKLNELIAGSDNQARILNDRLKELVAGSENQTSVMNERLRETIAGMDNLQRLLNEKVNQLLEAPRAPTPIETDDEQVDLPSDDGFAVPDHQRLGLLTAVLPTHNRHRQCASQLRFLRENGFDDPIIVLDSSDEEQAAAVRAACTDVAEYRHFPATFRLVEKLVSAVGTIETPYVILIPDDDIILPHAIARALDVLQQRPDYIATHGYFLSFAIHQDDFDFDRVIGFTPSISADEPLTRQYDLMRRYQSFYWGVFRTRVFANAVAAAQAMNVVLFRELTVMNTSILQGKVARLPMIHALRGQVASVAPIQNSNPLIWFLRDAKSFVQAYVSYRDGLAKFIRERGIAGTSEHRLEQLLDVVHMTWLAREIELGTVNHAARQMIQSIDTLIEPPPTPLIWREPTADDLVHESEKLERRYIWRKGVLTAEPRHEIRISHEEMRRVERQLDAYRLMTDHA